MQIINVDFHSIWEYGEDKEENKRKEEEKIIKRRSMLEALGVDVSGRDDKEIKSGNNFLVTQDQLILLLQKGEHLTVKSKIDFEDRQGSMVSRLELVMSKISQFVEAKSESFFNERVEVHTPGAGLMLFNSTLLLENACSDELQMALDNGWRIIAACPQPDSRRPDYILGRYDPNHEAGSERAKRSV